MTVNLTLTFMPMGDTPAGTRIDVPFTGTATSSRWEGELPVDGVDYVTVGKGGVTSLDIRARMGTGDNMVSYSATGRVDGTGPMEVLTFQTASEAFADLNGEVAIAFGTQEKNKLTLDVYLPRR